MKKIIIVTTILIILLLGCVNPPICGNNICESGENESNCSYDCLNSDIMVKINSVQKRADANALEYYYDFSVLEDRENMNNFNLKVNITYPNGEISTINIPHEPKEMACGHCPTQGGTFSLDGNRTGKYELEIIADSDDNVLEINEENNYTSINIYWDGTEINDEIIADAFITETKADPPKTLEELNTMCNDDPLSQENQTYQFIGVTIDNEGTKLQESYSTKNTITLRVQRDTENEIIFIDRMALTEDIGLNYRGSFLNLLDLDESKFNVYSNIVIYRNGGMINTGNSQYAPEEQFAEAQILCGKN